MMQGSGYFRIINIRGDRELAPTHEETVIDMDRSHAVLGNRHVLRNSNDMAERLKVLKAHEADVDADFAIEGPIYQALLDIACRIAAGEKIVGRCWCYPRPCHLDTYAKRINALATADQGKRAS